MNQPPSQSARGGTGKSGAESEHIFLDSADAACYNVSECRNSEEALR